MIGAFKSRQFVMFLVTGGLAAAVNFGSRILYNQWMGFSAAIVLAYITGMITAFVLARIFVFQDSQLADHVLPSLGVQRFVHEIAHAVGVVVPVFSSYLGHKHLSFKSISQP